MKRRGVALGERAADATLAVLVPAPADRYEPFPLTDIQQAYWLGRGTSFELLGGVAGYFYYEIESATLELDRVTRAWQRLVERHDVLRLVVLPDGRQRVLEHVPPCEIQAVDLRAQPPAEVSAVLAELRDEMSHQVLDPERWPLFDLRAAVLPDRVRLFLGIDGLLLDGASLRIVLGDLGRLYDDLDCVLPELEVSFRDYVLAEHALHETAGWQQSLAYWRDVVPKLPPAPDLPLARGRPSATRSRFVRYSGTLDAERWARFQARVARMDLTPSGVLLAAFAEILGCWSSTPQFTLNVAFLNRLPLHPRVDEIVGEFATFLLLDVDAQRRDAFGDRARRLQKTLWKNLPHAYVGGASVLRELSRLAGQPVTMPVAYTSVLNQKGSRATPSIGDLGTLIGGIGTVGYQISQTPQVWLDLHVFEVEGGLGFDLDAVEDRFAPGVCEAMFGAFQHLVERLATDDQTWAERTPSTLPPGQIELQNAINDTAAPVPDATLTAAILAQAERRPEALAVVAEQRLSYAEIVARARRIAGYLTSAGVAGAAGVAGVALRAPIGIAMEKGWEQIASALGVLEAGMAYLPIDPASPPERLAFVFETAGVELVLTHGLLAETLEWPAGLRVVTTDDACASAAPFVPRGTPDPDALAMVILTSGSTGIPRGVMLPHRGPLNAVVDLNRRFGVTSADRLLSLTPMQHDMAAYDLFGILGAGGTLVMPRADVVRDPAHWLALMRAERVTVWNSVPAMMQMLLEYVERRGERLPDSLRLVMLGGDFIPLDFPRRLAAQVPSARLVSVGGPTETSIVSICYPVDAVDPQWASIPYGRPIANQRVYVLDDELDPRPIWVPGQIWSAGLGVALGYLGNDEETQASFLLHPRTGERLYRTGDRGLYRADGTLEILGRVDFQVKINGVRIEPAEIDLALRAHPHVTDALVVATGEPGGRRALVAYVVTGEPAPADAELREFLAARLPRAMVPAVYVQLDALPLGANGKIDRRALPPPPQPGVGEPAHATQLSPRQQAIQETIAGVLDIQSVLVVPTEAFFDLGGDSLRAVLIQSKLREKFGVEVPLRKFFEPSTLLAIDQAIDQAIAEAAGDARLPVIQQRVDRHSWPLSSAQSRLFFLEQIAPGAPIWNVAFGIRLQGALDVPALEAALREIKRRHETLRATFTVGPGGRPQQAIGPDAPLHLHLHDVSRLPAPEGWSAFAALAATEARRGFDLASGPLQRELLVRLADDDHALVIIVHHLSADAWSFGVILNELRALYGAFARAGRAGRSPLPEPVIQYADYAAWELRVRDDTDERTRARYWRDRMAGAPPFLSLPTDRERPATLSYEGALHPIALAEGTLKDELRGLCSAESATPFMALLTTYAIVMSAWSGQRDVVIGAPLANRRSVETEALVGCFVNMIPLRIDLTRARSFREALRAVKTDILGDFSRELPFEQLVRAVNPQRSPARTPLFQVVLQLDAMTVPSLDWSGLKGELLPLDSGTARYELAIRLIDDGGGFSGQMNYRRDLWDPATMAAVARTFADLLARAVRDPDTSIAALEVHASACWPGGEVTSSGYRPHRS